MHLLRKPKPPKPIVNEAKSDLKTSHALSSQEDREYRGDVRVNDDLKVYPIHPRGPPQFPPGRVLKRTDPFAGLTFSGILENLSRHIDMRQSEVSDEFSQVFAELEEDQWTDVPPQQIVMPSILKSSIISKQNYLKLTSWFSVHVPKQEYLHEINISSTWSDPEVIESYHSVIASHWKFIASYCHIVATQHGVISKQFAGFICRCVYVCLRGKQWQATWLV